MYSSLMQLCEQAPNTIGLLAIWKNSIAITANSVTYVNVKNMRNYAFSASYQFTNEIKRSCFGTTYTKIGTIQRRLAWPLRKDDTQIREAFHIFVFFHI